jgi:hypothetical protein
VYLNYTNVVVFPVVWLLRRWSARRAAARPNHRFVERVPPGWINALLRATFVRLGRSRVPFPFGVSLLIVARRK